MTAPHIRAATLADVTEVAAVIAEAFGPLQATAWLVPDPPQRPAILPAMFAIHVEHALTYGHVHTARDEHGRVAGAAVWLDYTRDVPPPPDYDARLAAACGRYTERFQNLDQLFEAHHPTRPHHHLAFLAVRPHRQRARIGTALLYHHSSTLDCYAIGGYLEASSQPARDLYLRHGWQPMTAPFELPNEAAFWPMWRTPTHAESPARPTGGEW